LDFLQLRRRRQQQGIEHDWSLIQKVRLAAFTAV